MIKFLEDSIEGNLDNLGHGNEFLDTTQITGPMKKIIDNVDFIKIKKKSAV